MIEDLFFAFTVFLDKGGMVLNMILALAIVLFILFSKRFIYLIFDAPKEIALLEAQSFSNRYDKQAMMLRRLYKHYFGRDIIKLSIVILPLLGLLGTVTGMIEVFEVMAHFGNSNARLMASGVAKAIIPTMSAMALAVIGLIAYAFLQSLMANRNRMAEKVLQ